MIDTDPRIPAAEPPAPVSNGNLTNLVAGILEDAQKLARQQVEMLKSEVREDFRRSKRAAEFGGLGVVLLTVGFLGLVMALAYFLHEHYQFSLWASWSITGGHIFLVSTASTLERVLASVSSRCIRRSASASGLRAASTP